MEQFLGGLQVLLQWQNFLIIPVGLAIGIIVGAIPGLTSDLGLILCIPLTYGMDPTMAILMLLAIYCGGTYGGSITAILINTPGTSANAATLFDGYPMTQRGQAFKALQMALYASTIGGLISAFALLFLAPQIAKITLLFGPAEYFALAVFGLSVIAGVSNNSIFKGLIGACIGLFMATIGMAESPSHGDGHIIRNKRGKQDVCRCRHDCAEHRDREAGNQIFIFKNSVVSVKAEFTGPPCHRAAGCNIIGCERVCKHIPERIDAGKAHDDQNHNQHNIKCAIAFQLFRHTLAS